MSENKVVTVGQRVRDFSLPDQEKQPVDTGGLEVVEGLIHTRSRLAGPFLP